MSRRDLIDRVFSRLVELDCDPKLSQDGRTIRATCPCCMKPGEFFMHVPEDEREGAA